MARVTLRFSNGGQCVSELQTALRIVVRTNTFTTDGKTLTFKDENGDVSEHPYVLDQAEGADRLSIRGFMGRDPLVLSRKQ